jgi:competence protein ComEA
MNQIKKIISLYFNLSRKEANGFIILSLLIPIFIFLPWIGRLCFSSYDSIPSKDQHTMNTLLAQMENNPIIKTDSMMKEADSKKDIIYSYFDPNVASENEMIHSGVPDFVAVRIVKFRSKGGIFKTKEDLKKIYGLSAALYQQLYPHISIADSPKPTHSSRSLKREVKNTIQPFDLNKADSLTLVALKGIGPTLAGRILKYRLKLGGFLALKQLQEVYGLDSIALGEIDRYGYIDKNFSPVKIDLNSTDDKAFRDHPYIGKKITTMIVSYRNQHGHFTSAEQLKNIKSIPEQAYLKMLPYLK